MRHFLSILCLCVNLLLFLPCRAAEYRGRVVDVSGEPIAFATVYLEENPIVGTATGLDGMFALDTDAGRTSKVIVSFVGYAKVRVALAYFEKENAEIRLREQPIALEEMVISGKASRQKNKHKQMASLLYQVYNRMEKDFPMSTYSVGMVSEVKMDSEDVPCGMEQMMATVVQAPRLAVDERDSVQFQATYAKRFFPGFLRTRADSVLAGNKLDGRTRRLAVEMDSGVVVHKSLWKMGHVRYDFSKQMRDVKHWTVSRENEHETVLTYREAKNYVGIVKYEFLSHYIVDSETYEVRRFSQEGTMTFNIPFGYKLKPSELEVLNMINMDEKAITKFRLRRATASVQLNTLFQRVDGHLYPLERNMRTSATLTSTKGDTMPVKIRATQRVTQVKTKGVQLLRHTPSRRVRRENVLVY